MLPAELKAIEGEAETTQWYLAGYGQNWRGYIWVEEDVKHEQEHVQEGV